MRLAEKKISIITPVFNQVKYIEQTILSVINQDYQNLEYIIVDGGSTDGTLEIIKSYEDKITLWVSEPDSGMYDALNKGFKISTGEIMTWINSDDILISGALTNMNGIMSCLSQVNWVQGLNSFINQNGKVYKRYNPRQFSFLMFLNKDYKWIQQESTFWRRSLWEQSGSKLNINLKLAGDFELWFRFFQFDKLYTVDVPIGAWRKREGQLSGVSFGEYTREVCDVISNYKLTGGEKRKLKTIRYYIKIKAKYNNLKLLKRIIQYRINSLYNLNNYRINYLKNKKSFVISKD